MSEPARNNSENPVIDKIYSALESLISKVPDTGEKTSANPDIRAMAITREAAGKSALLTGGLALPPGPLGLATIIPDLIAIWKLQSQLVADIAGAYGKTPLLQREQMMYCLFRHAVAQVARDLVTRVGERLLIREVPLQVLQKVLNKVSYRISQRMLGKAISRWLPVAGAVAVGSYAYYDTRQVGLTAMEYFKQAPLDLSRVKGKIVDVEADVHSLNS